MLRVTIMASGLALVVSAMSHGNMSPGVIVLTAGGGFVAILVTALLKDA